VSQQVGIGWSTYFKRRKRHLRQPRLKYAYRSPSFFGEAMRAQGHPADFLLVDESWDVQDFNGKRAALQDSVDVLYVCTHGQKATGSYRAVLHGADWEPFVTGIGNGTGPWIAVFDTCDLIDLSDPRLTGRGSWMVGKSLRLLLGFASLATVDTGPSVRGRAFAANMTAGLAVADAWLQAVHSTGFPGLDRAIAIAFGDDPSDARTVLDSATLASPVSARTAATPAIAWKVCH
jgi:hypothetical protein